jgi:hypothetical protein
MDRFPTGAVDQSQVRQPPYAWEGGGIRWKASQKTGPIESAGMCPGVWDSPTGFVRCLVSGRVVVSGRARIVQPYAPTGLCPFSGHGRSVIFLPWVACVITYSWGVVMHVESGRKAVSFVASPSGFR